MRKTWIPLTYVTEKLEKRKWWWGQDFSMKYLDIRVDTRDNYCTVWNNKGECIASTKEELDALFDKMDKELHHKTLTFQKMRNMFDEED